MTAIEIAKDAYQLLGGGISKAIIDRLRVPPRRDDFLGAQLRQMLRKRALAQRDEFSEFADRHFAAGKATKNRKALLAGEKLQKMRGLARARLKHLDGRSDGFRFTRLRRGTNDFFHFRIFVYSAYSVNVLCAIACVNPLSSKFLEARGHGRN